MRVLRCERNFAVISILLLLISSLPVFGQTERWVFRYNGPADSADVANSLVYGADGNIYAAGYSQGVGTGRDFIVISLNKDNGDTNWVYRYNGPGNGADAAKAVVYGGDSNIYAAGYSMGSGTGYDFIVISLDKDTGDTNWVYRYNGPGNGWDRAYAIVWGMDGNLYAAGYSVGVNTRGDFTIISLTPSGAERWLYRYNGPVDSNDVANAIVYGADGNIYTAGWNQGNGGINRFTVISLTNAGSKRWVYADSVDGVANCLAYGSDGNIYAAGYFSIYYDIGIVSLTALGSERWRYSYAGPPGSSGDDWDEIHSIVHGADGNIYAAGVSDSTDWTEPTPAFTVISLTTAGSERWVYRYYSGLFDWANSIIYGSDSNLYAAGMCFQGTRAFGVISLTPTGGERWIYRYNTPYVDEATCIIYGGDGNIYAAGYSESRNTSFAQDIIVVSLDPETGIEEQLSARIDKGNILSTATLQRRNRFDYSLSLPRSMNVRLALYNIVGEEILCWTISAPVGTSNYSKELPVLSYGIYILKVETSEKEYNDTRKIIYAK
ncbi:PQQ-like beta-propeller repeat protein [candidate division WOR-3 bacterium]|nr:PQQ-like beta-propeller repeat protein [candidate division WOR-3 bacterium]